MVHGFFSLGGRIQIDSNLLKTEGTNPYTIHAPVHAPGEKIHAPIHAPGEKKSMHHSCTFSCTFSYTFLRAFSIEMSFFYSYTGSAELARLTMGPALGAPGPHHSLSSPAHLLFEFISRSAPGLHHSSYGLPFC